MLRPLEQGVHETGSEYWVDVGGHGALGLRGEIALVGIPGRAFPKTHVTNSKSDMQSFTFCSGVLLQPFRWRHLARSSEKCPTTWPLLEYTH